jgi:hypothetical protein
MRFNLAWSPWTRPSELRLAAFVNPVNPAPRTAILGPGFQRARNTRVFADGWSQAARQFGPGVLAGGVDQLRQAARGRIRLSHAVVVLTYDLRLGVSEEEREMLWRVLGVPVYEQYLSADHQLLAMDCEAHAGLHVIRGCEALAADSNLCGCGSQAPRLAQGAQPCYAEVESSRYANVAELADAPDLGSGSRKGMGVRPSPFAPQY